MRQRHFILGVAVAGLLMAWVATGPRILALINWDNGAYISGIASGHYSWSTIPWNSHFGIGHEYLIGTFIARRLGGTVIDGFRLTSALFFAWACAALADTLYRLLHTKALAAILTLAWMTAWVNFHYHLILEDNFLFLAPVVMVMRLCVLHVANWQVRHSFLAGMFCAIAVLGSWQAMPYLGPAVYAALIGPGRPWRARARDVLVVPLSFLLTSVTYALFIAATSQLGAGTLLRTMFSRPNPSFFPQTQEALLKDLAAISMTVGTGAAYHLSHNAYGLPHIPVGLDTLGIVALVLQGAVFFIATVWSRRRHNVQAHLLAATLLLLTFVTALHPDLATYAELKRFDFIPLLFAFLLATMLPVRGRAVVAAGLILVILTQTGLALRWAHRRLESYTYRDWGTVPHAAAGFYGRDGQSWFAYFRHIREQNSRACSHVFSVAELYDGWWNFEITGSLWSELPNHIAIAAPEKLREWKAPAWRYPVRYATVAAIKARPEVLRCAWLSSDAMQLVTDRESSSR